MSDADSALNWAAVPGFVGIYEANEAGQIRRVGRSSGAQPGRIKTLTPHSAGYLSVHLYRDNVEYSLLVHRVIAEAFLGPIPDGFEVNHKNGIKTDNRLANLEVVTSRQNTAHAIENGLQDFRGERSPNARLTWALVAAIRAEYVPGSFGYTRLGRKYGVCWGTIRDVIKEKTWTS